MLLNGLNVRKITTHPTKILSIFRFADNDDDHYVSISSDYILKEWSLNDFSEIQYLELDRPEDDFLINNGHKVVKERNNTVRNQISKVYVYKQNIFLGFEDGLILVWGQQKQESTGTGIGATIDPEKASESNQVEGDEIVNNIISSNDVEAIEEKQETNFQRSYKNFYNLDYVFIGQFSDIIDFYFHEEKNHLLSTSHDLTIKIWDLTKGYSIYHFNLDTPALKILYSNDKKEQNFILICKDPYKIKLNYLKDPISIATSNFPYSGYDCFFDDGSKYYLGGSSGVTNILDYNLAFQAKIVDKQCGNIMNLSKWKDHLISVGDDKLLKVYDPSGELCFMLPFFKDDITVLLTVDDVCIAGSYDKSIYKIDLQLEKKSAWDKSRMEEEDKFSSQLSSFVNAQLKAGKKLKAPVKPTIAAVAQPAAKDAKKKK